MGEIRCKINSFKFQIFWHVWNDEWSSFLLPINNCFRKKNQTSHKLEKPNWKICFDQTEAILVIPSFSPVGHHAAATPSPRASSLLWDIWLWGSWRAESRWPCLDSSLALIQVLATDQPPAGSAKGGRRTHVCPWRYSRDCKSHIWREIVV